MCIGNVHGIHWDSNEIIYGNGNINGNRTDADFRTESQNEVYRIFLTRNIT